MVEIHIARGRQDAARNDVEDCAVCKRPQIFYSWFQDYYGWNGTCSNCGDAWQDGEHMPRSVGSSAAAEAERVAMAPSSVSGPAVLLSPVVSAGAGGAVNWSDCPACGSRRTVVGDTRERSGHWYRRRKCSSCDNRWTTYEISEDEYRQLKTAEGDLETIVRALRGRVSE